VVVVRWLFFSVFIPFCFSSSSGQVLLNEVYYDHPGRDEGFEFVELLNTSADASSLGGYRLDFHDGASSGWVTIWEAQIDDTIGGLGGLFVIGGEGIARWCDVVFDLGLQNGPDAICLVNRGGVVDVLGYGPLDDPAFFEGRSAPDVSPGFGLARVPDGNDTNDNQSDFIAAQPSPGRFNVPRDDVMIRVGEGTSSRAVWPGATSEIIRLCVSNSGLCAVARGAASVELEDSTGLLTRVVGSVVNDVELAPGDSLEVAFTVELEFGYHFASARVLYPPDERTGNNVLNLVRWVGAVPLVVSEVMSHPRSGCPEYIELFNAGGESYDLAGHWLRDAAHAPARVASTSTPVEPGGFAVLTSDEKALRGCFAGLGTGVVEIEGAWPSLNHTGGSEADSIVLLDSLMLPLIRVSYPPQPADSRGRSLERVDLYASAGPAIWVLSHDPRGGSPGQRHAGAILNRPDGPGVRASPNPFDPWGSETLFLTIPEQPVSSRVVVSIFDIRGRRVKDVGAPARLPSVVAWDGTDNEGRLVVPGFYVVACEFVSSAAGNKRVERVVVGCAKKTRH
jgi:hypothetical protein